MVPVPNNYRRLDGSERHRAPGARRIGPAHDHDEISVTIHLRRRRDAPILPDQEYWTRIPPGQRTYASRADFAKSYGAAEADIDRVTSFAHGHGLQIREVDPAQRVVVISGSIGQINKAFGVELNTYEAGGRTFRGREGYIHLPEDLGHAVQGVFGLDNRRMSRRSAKSAASKSAADATLSPRDVAKVYNFPPVPKNINEQTIGLFQFSDPVTIGTCGYRPSDIAEYFGSHKGIGPGVASPRLVDVVVAGHGNRPGGADDVEVTLDIAIAGAVAQGARIAVYFSTWDENGWIRAFKRAVYPRKDDPAPSVISISWMWPEFEALGNLTWSAAAIEAVSETCQEAAAFGITIIAASGDQGSQCQIPDGRAHVYYPQSDPWVTCCGGTAIKPVPGKPLSPTFFKETTWNDNGATGGGISEHFAVPSWQKTARVPASVNPGNRKGRGIPDIAGFANGYAIVHSGARLENQCGTSEAAPHYAGLIAIINAMLNDRVGYLNPTLYQLGGTNVFRDIADGGSNARDSAPGYTAGRGWDCCTGWGSINGRKLVDRIVDWKGSGTTGGHSGPTPGSRPGKPEVKLLRGKRT
jgi:kumamolisin